jgi:hypothetical protein
MYAHFRIIIACALLCALAAPAVSSAQDDHGYVPTSSLAGTTSAPSQDLRSPDSRDAAGGRGTLVAPDVTAVKVPQAAPVRGNPAISRDAGGSVAVVLFGLILFGMAGATVIAQRRRRGLWTAPAA